MICGVFFSVTMPPLFGKGSVYWKKFPDTASGIQQLQYVLDIGFRQTL
jgi:hypothetical protein